MPGQLHLVLVITGSEATIIRSVRGTTGTRAIGLTRHMPTRIGSRRVITATAIIPVTGAVNTPALSNRPLLRNGLFLRRGQNAE